MDDSKAERKVEDSDTSIQNFSDIEPMRRARPRTVAQKAPREWPAIRSYGCSLCGVYATRFPALLNKHVTTCLVRLAPYVCPKGCKSRFSSMGAVTGHLKFKCARPKSTCPLCLTKIEQKSLDEHFDTHGIWQYTCSKCSEVFKRRRPFYKHRKSNSGCEKAKKLTFFTEGLDLGRKALIVRTLGDYANLRQ
jgi:hypothetical protein